MTGVSQRAKNRMIAVNEQGRRIGESHPRAVLSDHEVDLVLELLDSGLSQRVVAEKMEVSRRCVRDIASGRRRAQVPAAWRARAAGGKR